MNKKNSKKWVCPECGIITTFFYEYRKHQHVYAGPDQYMKSWSEREAKLDARIKELEETLGEGIYLAGIFTELGSMDNWCHDAGNLLPKEKQE